jgi:hypothetical protein
MFHIDFQSPQRKAGRCEGLERRRAIERGREHLSSRGRETETQKIHFSSARAMERDKKERYGFFKDLKLNQDRVWD